MIKLWTVGGYSEVGKNMSVLEYKDEAVILDMGFYLPALMGFEEGGGDRRNLTPKGLIKIGAIPDDDFVKSLKGKIKAIVLSHCHLDHIGGVPYLAKDYNAPVVGTPYTIEVLRGLYKDEGIEIENELEVMKAGYTMQVSKNIEIEFINVTHSTLDCVLIVIRTPDGVVVYANDFKLDNHPVIGRKPDYTRLKEIGRGEKVLGLIVDSLYADRAMKTPSERVAREMLRDVMFGADNYGHGLFVTSFASHIHRLKSMVDFGRKLNRKIVFLGRSLRKYVGAAERLGLVDFHDVETLSYGREVEGMLKKVEKNRSKYLVVCTGGQAEPGAILTRIGNGKLPFRFKYDDHVIFSCSVIPVEANIKARGKLEKELSAKGVRLFTDIHASGHASREDLRDLIDYLKPKKLIPGHGGRDITSKMEDLAKMMKYDKNFLILSNGKKIEL